MEAALRLQLPGLFILGRRLVAQRGYREARRWWRLYLWFGAALAQSQDHDHEAAAHPHHPPGARGTSCLEHPPLGPKLIRELAFFEQWWIRRGLVRIPRYVREGSLDLQAQHCTVSAFGYFAAID